MSLPEDRSVLAQVRSDADALNAFLATVERRAFRIAQIATRDRDNALDIVQDAMMQLAQRYGRRPAAEWGPLFHRILQNRVVDWQRRNTVRRRWLAERPSPTGAEDAEDPLEAIADPTQREPIDRLQRDESMRELESALRALPRRQREAFILRIWEGLNVDQTATAMGCSDGSVKTHLSRALAFLRAQLKPVWN